MKSSFLKAFHSPPFFESQPMTFASVRYIFSRDFPDLDVVFYELEKMKVPRFDHLMDLFADDKEVGTETSLILHLLMN